MELITPDFGIFFWQTVTLSVVIFILGKFAWKPILRMLGEREAYIAQSLQNAQEARNMVIKMKEEQDKLLEQSTKEREKILYEAIANKHAILEAATIEAKQLSHKVLEETRAAIAAEKELAFDKLKQEVAALSIQVAEKLLAQELHPEQRQEELVRRLVKETKL
jgi:F-type H+-transporting ATPase subunit b